MNNMESTMINNPDDILQDSCSLVKSRFRLASNQDSRQSADLSSFKQEVEENYKLSIPNQIYSFPLRNENCSSFVSSDNESLEKQEPYDLNNQNRQHEDLARKLQQQRSIYQQTKLEIENQKERTIKHIQEQSQLKRKKYENLLKLMAKSKTPKKDNGQKTLRNQLKKLTISKSRLLFQQRQKEKYYMYLERNDDKKGRKSLEKSDILRNKSQRLKTEPNQIFKCTSRKIFENTKLHWLFN